MLVSLNSNCIMDVKIEGLSYQDKVALTQGEFVDLKNEVAVNLIKRGFCVHRNVQGEIMHDIPEG